MMPSQWSELSDTANLASAQALSKAFVCAVKLAVGAKQRAKPSLLNSIDLTAGTKVLKKKGRDALMTLAILPGQVFQADGSCAYRGPTPASRLARPAGRRCPPRTRRPPAASRSVPAASGVKQTTHVARETGPVVVPSLSRVGRVGATAWVRPRPALRPARQTPGPSRAPRRRAGFSCPAAGGPPCVLLAW